MERRMVEGQALKRIGQRVEGGVRKDGKGERRERKKKCKWKRHYSIIERGVSLIVVGRQQ